MTAASTSAARTRHPGDVVRVVLGTVTLAACAIAARGRVPLLERDVFRLVNHFPGEARDAAIVATQAGAVASVPVVALVAVFRRRALLAGGAIAAGLGSYAVAKVLKHLVERGRPAAVLEAVTVRAGDLGLGFPSGHAAVSAALATVIAPHLSRGGRRLIWAAAVIVAVSRVYLGVHLPLDVAGGAALGWCLGSVWNLAAGTPRREPPPAEILAGVARVVADPDRLLHLDADARASAPFTVSSPAGEHLVKVVTTENRDADLLFKLARLVIFRHVEDETPFATAKQAVEHEGYALVMAERSGARVPHLRGTAAIGSAAIVVTDFARGVVPLDERGGVGLADAWEQVALLHRAGIAHRDLRPANVLVDAEGTATIIDFGFAEIAASERRIALDAAELLAGGALVAGPAQSVATAVGHGRPEVLRAALPLLQPLALSGATRSRLRRDKQLLPALRSALAAELGVDDVHLEPLVRVRPATLTLLAGLAFAVHLLIPQVGELHRTWELLGHARLGWVGAALGFSVATYLAAGLALLGAAPVPLPYARTVFVQLAASFTNRLAPAGLGGMGINVRYLQRHGLDRTSAATTVATNSLAGFVVHVVLLTTTATLTGRAGVGRVHLPRGWHLLTGAALVLLVAGLIAGTPLRRRVSGPLRTGVRQLATLLRSPGRAALTFAGAFGVTSGYILALAASVHAYTGDAALTKVALAFLAGSAVASAAPTPGGLGAMEAALVAALTGLGVHTSPAIAGVLTFRVATFWLPTLPGWVCYRALRGAEEL